MAEQTLLESGQVLSHHSQDRCLGSWCAIHRPMPGPWSSWPRWWREDRGILERTCPHGVGHPVAEMVDWAIANGKGYELVHGCDSCPCAPRMAKRFQQASPTNIIGIPDAPTQLLPVLPVPLDKLEVLRDALDLISDLWPKPSYASVTLESHQWVKLRRVLLAIPDLVDRP